MDRFDVLSKPPEGTSPESLKLMLQSLLAERFHLVVHNDTRPLPTYALTAGKKPRLRPADGTEETGCTLQAAAPSAGGIRLLNSDRSAGVIRIRPGATFQTNCRNMTMAALADEMRNMIGTAAGTNPVLDRSGMKETGTSNLSGLASSPRRWGKSQRPHHRISSPG
jgi:uncharacterized protein (TIGR03435 family)